jgi:hypothetical protein
MGPGTVGFTCILDRPVDWVTALACERIVNTLVLRLGSIPLSHKPMMLIVMAEVLPARASPLDPISEAESADRCARTPSQQRVARAQ